MHVSEVAPSERSKAKLDFSYHSTFEVCNFIKYDRINAPFCVMSDVWEGMIKYSFQQWK